MKSVCAIGLLDSKYYLITCRLNHATNAEFVDWFYEINDSIKTTSVQCYNFVENNKLQDPFYEQVFVPLFIQKAKEKGYYLNISPDTRSKPDKFSRIEGNLEPINRSGWLIFNKSEKGNPHFERMQEQFLLITPQLKAPADGPDCVEGAIFIATQSKQSAGEQLIYGKRPRNKKRV